jgi:hypothetical protein
MLAHLTDEPLATCEPAPVDPTLAARRIDDQGVLAQAAYEAALQLDDERWWIPVRRRRPTIGAGRPRRCRGRPGSRWPGSRSRARWRRAGAWQRRSREQRFSGASSAGESVRCPASDTVRGRRRGASILAVAPPAIRA